MELGSKEIQQYIKSGGDYCPYLDCQSREVEEGDLLVYDEETVAIHRGMVCLTCGKEWTDIFTLAAVKGGKVK